jgi:hypothetical protein
MVSGGSSDAGVRKGWTSSSALIPQHLRGRSPEPSLFERFPKSKEAMKQLLNGNLANLTPSCSLTQWMMLIWTMNKMTF